MSAVTWKAATLSLSADVGWNMFPMWPEHQCYRYPRILCEDNTSFLRFFSQTCPGMAIAGEGCCPGSCIGSVQVARKNPISFYLVSRDKVKAEAVTPESDGVQL